MSNLSKEEIEAIEKVKLYIEWVKDRETDTDEDIEIILNLIDKLQKKVEELRDIKNKAIGHINCCKTSLGNYILSPSEVECLLDILKEGDIE